MPNPCPLALKIQVLGEADRVEAKIYTPAMVCVGTVWAGPCPVGWVNLPLPQEFLGARANGLYYYRVVATRGGSASNPKIGRFMVIR